MSGYDEHNLPEYESGDHVAKQAMIAFTLIAAIIALLIGVYLVATRHPMVMPQQPDGDKKPVAAETATPTEGATPTEDKDNPCPVPEVKPNQSPKQFEKAPDPATAASAGKTATISTSCGDITVELYADKAPAAVANFAFLAKEDFWKDTLCHRLTTQGIYVLQCGDPTATSQGGPGYKFGPVENAPEGDIYEPGVLAMARAGNSGDSMGSQFFLVHDKSQIPSDTAGGYTVFGKITEGLDIVKKIAEGGAGGGATDGPPNRKIAITGVKLNG